MRTHPLDPVSAAEIEQAIAVARADGRPGECTRFWGIYLDARRLGPRPRRPQGARRGAAGRPQLHRRRLAADWQGWSFRIGDYELVCLPAKLVDAEGSFTRAILIKRDPS